MFSFIALIFSFLLLLYVWLCQSCFQQDSMNPIMVDMHSFLVENLFNHGSTCNIFIVCFYNQFSFLFAHLSWLSSTSLQYRVFVILVSLCNSSRMPCCYFLLLC